VSWQSTRRLTLGGPVEETRYGQINDDVLAAMEKPRAPFFFAVAFLAMLVGVAALCWMYQIQIGMGVSGLNRPVGWATYITNFVFWVGIAHSGTLISAILFLLRANWRDAVSRSAEAMTIFAIMTAGLFPLVHLGRLWAFYYILPYPSQRQLWPNFLSPLVWDVCAVSTYFTVSLIFWLVGLIPDLAAARDRYEETLGPDSTRARIYRVMALGWSGAGDQWHHYGRSYLFFAALATPLVISVHSVVSWDFAMSLLPGWHSAIFPPYFVAGAIHSGLAMVLTLLIPMRKLLHLESLIELHHFEMLAKTIILTATIVGYAYAVEAFIAWYSGDLIEWQFFKWRSFGPSAWMFWLCVLCNVLIPWLFIVKRIRTNIVCLFIISLFVNVGMWFERLMILFTSLAHDFLPQNWGGYSPTWVEMGITLGSFGFFFLWFFGFSKVLPTVPLSEMKGRIADHEIAPTGNCDTRIRSRIDSSSPGVLAVFSNAGRLLEAVKIGCDGGFSQMETFSPVKIDQLDAMLKQPKSPVRLFTLAGALCGLAGGFWLAIGTAQVNSLIVGGKPPVSLIPYCVIGFEGTILLGSVFNLIGLVIYARLYRRKTLPYYDRRFSRDKFGLLISCSPDQVARLEKLLEPALPEEIHVHQ
jgi:Ni/Fe-hydrogenase subunit HybB-like protein